MNTILPKFVDFNSETAFRPITQSYFYNNVQQYVSYIIAIITIVILAALIFVMAHARVNPTSYVGSDFIADVCAGFFSVFVGILPFIISFIMTHNWWPNISKIIIIICGLLIILFCQILLEERRLRLINICKSILVTMVTGFILLAGCIFLVNNKLNSKNYMTNVEKYNTTGFKINNTNLIAAPYKISTKLTKYENTHNLDPVKDYHKDNYYVYVDLANPRPKGIATKQITYKTAINTRTMKSSQNENNSNRKMNIYYLGQMKNGSFVPNYENIKVTHAFMGYQKYIKVHQLESKFKQHFSFKLSYKYLADNENPTLIVVGDNGFNLHYKNAKGFSYSSIVQSEKE